MLLLLFYFLFLVFLSRHFFFTLFLPLFSFQLPSYSLLFISQTLPSLIISFVNLLFSSLISSLISAGFFLVSNRSFSVAYFIYLFIYLYFWLRYVSSLFPSLSSYYFLFFSSFLFDIAHIPETIFNLKVYPTYLTKLSFLSHFQFLSVPFSTWASVLLTIGIINHLSANRSKDTGYSQRHQPLLIIFFLFFSLDWQKSHAHPVVVGGKPCWSMASIETWWIEKSEHQLISICHQSDIHGDWWFEIRITIDSHNWQKWKRKKIGFFLFPKWLAMCISGCYNPGLELLIYSLNVSILNYSTFIFSPSNCEWPTQTESSLF